MLGLFSDLIDLFRRESPQERYARACYEAEMEEKRQASTHASADID